MKKHSIAKPEPDDKEQPQQFIDIARQLESDESGEMFDKAFGIVAPITKPSQSEAASGQEI